MKKMKTELNEEMKQWQNEDINDWKLTSWDMYNEIMIKWTFRNIDIKFKWDKQKYVIMKNNQWENKYKNTWKSNKNSLRINR
jgi:hypothetical protein